MASYKKKFVVLITPIVALVMYMNSSQVMTFDIISNLSDDIMDYFEQYPPLSIILSYHPSFGNITAFNEHSNILSHLLTGHWKTRPLTKKEDDDILNFISNANARFHVPTNFQRSDGLCGNVTHTGSKGAEWIRALCDPKGITPCCFNNQCIMKSVEDCVCPDCYDIRHLKHAEYSTWIPSDSKYDYKEHSPQEACSILNGSTILFVGDSLVRHVYTAMLLIVTGNMKSGALNENVPEKIRSECSGMFMFTEEVCRLHLMNRLDACDGTVNLQLKYLFSAMFGKRLKRKAANLNSKSLLFTGIGIHNNYNYTDVQRMFLFPTLYYKDNNKRPWPKIVWAASHAPGIMKSPKVLAQTYESVKRYNMNMNIFLRRWKVPVFNTFTMTDGMASYDGEHYGLGMNVVKANLLLSYLNELRKRGLW